MTTRPRFPNVWESAPERSHLMSSHENIQLLRRRHGLSQSALAAMTGYTDRSSIAKVESGLVDLPESKLRLFAQALGVTVPQLMGFDPLP